MTVWMPFSRCRPKADRMYVTIFRLLWKNKSQPFVFRNMSGKRHPGRHISSSSTSRGGETFSCFCDSGKQLEILNFLPEIQDLGLTVFRSRKPGSPKRCLPVPKHKACQKRQGIRLRSVRCHRLEAENLEVLTVRKRNRKRKKCLFPASGHSIRFPIPLP